LDDIESVAAHGTIKLTLILPGPGTVQIVGKGTLAGASHKNARRTQRVIAQARLATNKAGRVVIVLAPTASAKKTLAKHGKLRATITITYTPTSGRPTSITRTVTFRSRSLRAARAVQRLLVNEGPFGAYIT
jgi:hypothetical protein